jgi:peptide/nickel transport system substrate-binding protein
MIGRATGGSLLAALVLIAACGRDPALETLNYGLTLSPTGIDPHLNASVELGIPLSSVYDTLVYRDPESGAFVPGLASGWSISADQLTYTFTLRDDVTFHDGEPFDAESVKANIDYVLDPDHNSQKAAAMLGPLSEVRVLGPDEVAFVLERPFTPLLDSLSQVYLGMASPTALAAWGPGEYQFHQVGSGPYRFVEYLPDDHLTLERNPAYDWAPTIYRASEAEIETITFRFYEDPPTRALALESGAVDIIGELPPTDVGRLERKVEFAVQRVEIPGQPLQFLFNTQLPPTDDLRVREALVLAVDRNAIVGTVFGGYSPTAGGPLAGAIFDDVDQPALPGFDPERARSLLVEAGWGPGPDSRPLELKLVAPNWGSNPEVAQLVAAAWESIGAQVTLEVAAGFGPLTQARAEGDYHAIGMNSFGTDPDLLRAFFDSRGFFNWSGVQDPVLDDLLTQASAEPGFDARTELYSEVARLVSEQWLILPVRDYVNLVGHSQRVDGLRFSAQGWFPLLIELRLRP